MRINTTLICLAQVLALWQTGRAQSDTQTKLTFPGRVESLDWNSNGELAVLIRSPKSTTSTAMYLVGPDLSQRKIAQSPSVAFSIQFFDQARQVAAATWRNVEGNRRVASEVRVYDTSTGEVTETLPGQSTQTEGRTRRTHDFRASGTENISETSLCCGSREAC